MENDLNKITGYNLFASVEKERIAYLLKYTKDCVNDEDIRQIIPNMRRDPEGKPINIGFLVYYETVVVEFRNFLNEVDFDYSLYTSIGNIRIKVVDAIYDTKSGKMPSLEVIMLHETECNLMTNIIVFGESACDILYEFAKQMKRNLS